VTTPPSPEQSLRHSRWFKLIGGASYQDLPAVRNLALIYSLAGADCIDVAADPAVVAAAREGIRVASDLTGTARSLGFSPSEPWLMVSLNDGEDPHFRKAEFDPMQCPTDCDRPCVSICPAQAIAFQPPYLNGVSNSRCYGCGRCIPICPYNKILTRSFVIPPALTLASLANAPISAIEIHTQVGHESDFIRVWREISPFADRFKLIAISCSDRPDLIPYLQFLAEIVKSLPCLLLWQLDGRPMSGDIGRGTTHAAIRLVQKVLPIGLPGYLQLAGGTNYHTVPKLREMGLLRSPVAGVAYGSYARSLLSSIGKRDADISETSMEKPLETNRDRLWQAVKIAYHLISQLKPIPAYRR
jgi:Fe-S-cluster-containing hydrogenase component 2